MNSSFKRDVKKSEWSRISLPGTRENNSHLLNTFQIARYSRGMNQLIPSKMPPNKYSILGVSSSVKHETKLGHHKALSTPSAGMILTDRYKSKIRGKFQFDQRKLLLKQNAKNIKKNKKEIPNQNLDTNGEIPLPHLKPIKQFIKFRENKKIRQYNLTIKGGKLVKNDAFLLFIKKFRSRLGIIRFLIEKIEKFCRHHRIVEIQIDGLEILEVAVDEINTIDIHSLVNSACINMKRQNLSQLEASIQIQSAWRGYKTAKIYRLMMKLIEKARKIQLAYRNFVERRNTRRIIDQVTAQRKARNEERLRELKGNWERVRNNQRFEIHIASKEPSDFATNFYLSQNESIMSICRTRDPLVHIIYISAVPIKSQDYFYAFLERCGVEDARQRLRFLVPKHGIAIKNGTFSTSLLLRIATKSINSISYFIKGRTAYIVPSQSNINDLVVGDLLDIPVLSTSVDVIDNLHLKDQAMNLYERGKIPVPLSSEVIKNSKDFYFNFANLILDDPETTKWILKINNMKQSYGTAMIDLSKSYKLTTFKKNKKTDREMLVNDLIKELKNSLQECVYFPHEQIWQSLQQYLVQFTRKSGVIQKGYSQVEDVCICLYIEPDHHVRYCGSVKRLSSKEALNVGLTFPQTVVNIDEIYYIASKMSEVLISQHTIGYVTLELLYTNESNAPESVVGIDIHLGINWIFSSILMFNTLCAGQFDLDTGNYFVEAFNDDFNNIQEEFKDNFTNIKVPLTPSVKRSLQSEFPLLNSRHSLDVNKLERSFSYIFRADHENIRRWSASELVMRCREYESLFYIDTCTGIVYSVYGFLGIMSISESEADSIKYLSEVFHFLLEVAGPPTSCRVTRSESYVLTDIIAMVKAQCIHLEKKYYEWRNIFNI